MHAELEVHSRAPLVGWNIRERVLTEGLEAGDFRGARKLLPKPPHGAWLPDMPCKSGGKGNREFRRFVSESDDGQRVRIRITQWIDEGTMLFSWQRVRFPAPECAFSCVSVLVRVRVRKGVGVRAFG